VLSKLAGSWPSLRENRRLLLRFGNGTGLIAVAIGAATSVCGLIFAVASIPAPSSIGSPLAIAAVLCIPAGVVLMAIGTRLALRNEDH
jgi:flagellar motor component MotA